MQDYQLALVAGQLRRAAARPARRALHAHAVLRPRASSRVLPDVRRRTRSARRSRAAPAGFHTERWAHAFRRRPASVLGADAAIGRTFAATLRPRRRRARARSPSAPRSPPATHALDDARRRPPLIVRTDRIEPSKNIVRGFLAYDLLLEDAPGAARSGSCSSRCSTRRASRCPSTSRTATRSSRPRRGSTSAGRPRDWEPVILDTRDDFPRSVAGLQRSRRAAREPGRDGLNLVAMEGPLAQPARRRAVPLTRGRRVRRAARPRVSACTRSTRADRGGAARALVMDAGRARRPVPSELRARAAREPAGRLARDPAQAGARLIASPQARPSSAGDEPGRTVDPDVGPRHELGRLLRRRAPRPAPRRRARPSPAGRPARRTRRGHRGRRRRTPPREAGARAPRPRRPCRSRPAGGARRPSWPGGARGRPRRRPGRPRPGLRRRGPGRWRQCSVTAMPSLRSTSTPGQLARSRRRRPPRTAPRNGSTRGSAIDPLAVPALEPVLADVGDAVDGERVAEELDRAAAHDADEPDLTDERRRARRVPRAARPRASGSSTIGDERAVEVRRAPRRRGACSTSGPSAASTSRGDASAPMMTMQSASRCRSAAGSASPAPWVRRRPRSDDRRALRGRAGLE